MESIGKLNRETIKYLAMAAMFLNHFSAVFLSPYKHRSCILLQISVILPRR